MATTTARPNTYAGKCVACGGMVAAGAGILGAKVNNRWTVKHSACASGCTTLTAAAKSKVATSRSSYSRPAAMCDECGSRPARYSTRDMSGIPGRVCGRCYEDGDCSFA